jgi:hypothetical protein
MLWEASGGKALMKADFFLVILDGKEEEPYLKSLFVYDDTLD